MSKLTPYDQWRQKERTRQQGTEFDRYISGIDGKGTLTAFNTTIFNPITWWSKELLPSVRQWALDTLSCPATSCQFERGFSSAKRLINPDRNRLGDDLIEALECLKSW